MKKSRYTAGQKKAYYIGLGAGAAYDPNGPKSNGAVDLIFENMKNTFLTESFFNGMEKGEETYWGTKHGKSIDKKIEQKKGVEPKSGRSKSYMPKSK